MDYGATIALRPYQQRLIDDIRAQMRAGRRRIVAVLPTGGGKTRIAQAMVQGAAARGLRSWFIVHRVELVRQTVATFGDMAGIIASGYDPQPDRPVQVCMVQSLQARMTDIASPDLILTDECHHATSATYRSVYDSHPSAWHVGLTATPARLDGKPLSGQYDAMVQGPPARWLMDHGFLNKYRYYAPDVPDFSLESIMDTAAVEKVMAGRAIVGSMTQHWLSHADGAVTVGFAPSVALSKKYAEAFTAAGIPSLHIDGETGDDEREEATRALADGACKVLWNVALLGEGYDLAAQAGRDVAIGCVILAAPTHSLGLNRQRLGRALRPAEVPAVILDHCGDILRHPMPDADILWSLDAPAKKINPDGRITPITRCPECYQMFAPQRACPFCGHEREVEERVMIYLPGELMEIKAAEAAAIREAEERRKSDVRRRVATARTLPELQQIGRELGYAPGWALIKYKSRMR